MLADVGGDECIPFCDLPDFFDHRLRLDDFVRHRIFEAVALTPLIDLLPPVGQAARIEFRVRRFQLGQKFLQHILDVADDRDIDLDPLRNRRRIDIDMDDLARMRRKMFWVADHAVVETGADRNQHIAVLHRHIRFVGAMHTGHADELVAGRPVRAQAHQGIGARKAEAVDQFVQLG